MVGSRKTFVILIASGFLLALSSGCSKKEPETPGPNAAPVQPEANQVVAGPNEPVAAEQTNCPVMAGPINKEIFVEYQGKKVYFCCDSCKEMFLKEPQKYLAKLPQFSQIQ